MAIKKISVFLVLCVLALTLSGCSEDYQETRDIKRLQLMSDKSSSVSGVFVLGFGLYDSSSETQTSYYTYIKGEEGFRLQKIDSENLEIVETNDVLPSIKGVFCSNGSIFEHRSYVAYVPIGTVYMEYNAQINIKD